MRQPKVITLEEVTIRFAGDSGDGIQLTGTLFSDATAHLGNDILTFPDYPAEIRAPKGTIGGVSGFQIHFGDRIIKTPGDYAHVLVAMNPAALKVNAGLLNPGGVIIFDTDTFTEKNFKKAEFETNDPFTELKMDDYIKMPVPVTSLTKEALKEFNLEAKTILRSKNMFTLGLVSWIFNRPVKYIEELINDKFSNKPTLAKANIKVLHSGYNYGLN
ncbi:MAG: 2-oxoacid:acceptor oxidoreductase subunit alpha, partial [Bacteroidales bacterium]|nr:2-oxoacid:acceptor oxidoreductase subunit alpha [Bacteroidales bacterium]